MTDDLLPKLNVRFTNRLLRKLGTVRASPLLSDGFRKSLLLDQHSRHIIGLGPRRLVLERANVTTVSALFILFANRSGSNYLSELLCSSGGINCAGEFFNHDVVSKHMTRMESEYFQYYLDYLLSLNVDGRLAIKASIGQYLLLDALGALKSHFEDHRIVVMQRDDKIDQAVSHWIAVHTRQWTSLQRSSGDSQIPIDVSTIRRMVNRAFMDERDTRLSLALLRRPYRSVVYENLVRNPVCVARSVLCEVVSGGGQLDVDLSKVRISKQAGNLNMDLRERVLFDD